MPIFLKCLCIVSMIWVFGCGWSNFETSDEDTELAQDTLIAALDAWKTGQAQSLSQRKPPIRFSDDDQLAGAVLVDYDLDSSLSKIGPFRDVTVELQLRDSRGKTFRKPVTYQVSLEPNLAVLRSDN